MTRLDTLKSLQARIREATGADRELDFAICKALGRAPHDAIWEVDENLPPELAKHYKRDWVTPAYVEQTKEFRRSFKELLASNPSEEQSEQWHNSHKRDWDWKNAPPSGNVPHFTTDPDGLGACIALMSEVLPGWDFELTSEGRCGDFWAALYPIDNDDRDRILGPDNDQGLIRISKSLCRSFLDAICAALIAEEEAKEKADV